MSRNYSRESLGPSRSWFPLLLAEALEPSRNVSSNGRRLLLSDNSRERHSRDQHPGDRHSRDNRSRDQYSQLPRDQFENKRHESRSIISNHRHQHPKDLQAEESLVVGEGLQNEEDDGPTWMFSLQHTDVEPLLISGCWSFLGGLENISNRFGQNPRKVLIEKSRSISRYIQNAIKHGRHLGLETEGDVFRLIEKFIRDRLFHSTAALEERFPRHIHKINRAIQIQHPLHYWHQHEYQLFRDCARGLQSLMAKLIEQRLELYIKQYNPAAFYALAERNGYRYVEYPCIDDHFWLFQKEDNHPAFQEERWIELLTDARNIHIVKKVQVGFTGNPYYYSIDFIRWCARITVNVHAYFYHLEDEDTSPGEKRAQHLLKLLNQLDFKNTQVNDLAHDKLSSRLATLPSENIYPHPDEMDLSILKAKRDLMSFEMVKQYEDFKKVIGLAFLKHAEGICDGTINLEEDFPWQSFGLPGVEQASEEEDKIIEVSPKGVGGKRQYALDRLDDDNNTIGERNLKRRRIAES